MSLPVSLAEFVDNLDVFGDDIEVLLNRRTGDFLVANADLRLAADAEDDEDIAEWQRQDVVRYRGAQESEDWIMLPSKFDLDEYRTMRSFCETLEDRAFAQDLYESIGGKGTFGRFKGMLGRRGLLDAWHRFREQALRELAKEWLEAEKVPYRE